MEDDVRAYDENVYIILSCDKFIYLQRGEWIERANYQKTFFVV